MTVELRISDPWELGEYLGWRTLESLVLREDRDAWLVELVQPFRYHDGEYRYIVVESRHQGTELSQIYGGAEISCNVTVTTAERAKSDQPCDISWWRGGHAMIGSVCIKQ
jgi:hypothetical protein